MRAQGRAARGALRSLREEESECFVQTGCHASTAAGEHVLDLVGRRMRSSHEYRVHPDVVREREVELEDVADHCRLALVHLVLTLEVTQDGTVARSLQLDAAGEAGDVCFQTTFRDILLRAAHEGDTGEIEVRDRLKLLPDRVCGAVRHDGDVRFFAELGEDSWQFRAKRDATLGVVLRVAVGEDDAGLPKTLSFEAFAEDPVRDVLAPQIRIERSRADGDAVNDPVVRSRIL